MRLQRTIVAASVLALGTFTTAVSLRAGGPSVDDIRPDGRGDTIRELGGRGGAGPKGSVATGNGINYHKGPVMHTVNLYYILYGNWNGLDPNGPPILTNWANQIAPSPYFNINTTYGDATGDVPNFVTFRGTYVDTGSLGTSLTDANVATLTSNAVKAGFSGSPNTPGVLDPNGLYMVLTAPGVKERSGFLTQYCGWHWSGSLVNGAIQAGNITPGYPVALFAFIGNAAGPSLSSCAAQSASPNGDAGADAMISVMAHELSEAASDPQGNAWYDSSGQENGDKCAWNFGTTYKAANGSSANVRLGGADYLMQQIWLNAEGGRCALSYSTDPDFSVSVSGSQTVAAGGTSGNYTLTATPANGFTGPVTWTIAPPPGITASTPAVANTATFTLTASPSLGPGSYSIPITGASGSLSHSTTATLVVSAPTYSLTITPASQSVTRPSGSTTVTYSVTVNQIGQFTSPVTLTVSKGTTGVTPSFPAGTNPVSPGGTATLNVVVTNRARKGTVALTVTGAAGATKKTATAALVVQ